MKNRNSKKSGPSFKEVARAEVDKLVAQRNLRNPHVYYSALDHLCKALGGEADLPPTALTPAIFSRLRTTLAADGFAPVSINEYLRRIRTILRLVEPYGLNHECIAELKNIQRQRFSETEMEPLRESQLKTILNLMQSQVETIQILIWIALSGGLQLVDAVFLAFGGVDWEKGLISFRRVRTGTRVEFAALPPLLELLKARRDRFGPDAVYVLPELIFTKMAIGDPKCNTVRWKGIPQPIAIRAASRAKRAINEFLKLCGIKTPAISHKSFRNYLFSFWAAIGAKEETLMRMTGHRNLDVHRSWATPMECEILRLRDITWQHLETIRQDRPFIIPTTPYDTYEALSSQWKEFADILRAAMRDLDGRFANLQSAMLEALAEQKTQMDQLAKIVQAKVGGLSKEQQ